MQQKYVLMLILLNLFFSNAFSETVTLDTCRDRTTWKFIKGGEFPGAKGAVTIDADGKLKLQYDFSGGGRYIGMRVKKKLPKGIKSFIVTMRPDADCKINTRVIDATGRVFQGYPKSLKKDEIKTILFKTNGPWGGAWGGKKSSKPQQPLRSFWIMVSTAKKKALKGSIKIIDCNVDMEKSLASKLNGKDISMSFDGWNIQGNWIKLATGTILKINAKNNSAIDSVLSLTFPMVARDATVRYNLSAKKRDYEFYYSPPLKGDGNPQNIYQIKMVLKSARNLQLSTPIFLNGTKSHGINFGKPIPSQDIKSSPMGTNVHFCFGTSRAFGVWKPYRKLIDEISKCGYKWIRDHCRVIKDQTGNYRVRPYDLEWIKYAVSKKINVVLLVSLGPNQPISEYIKKLSGIVKDTEGLVNVYELGNEPQNGGWRKKYKGSWNGYEKNGSISKWVKVHLKYTNALADHIKKIRPNATVIGLGANSPTNFHSLNLGVSKNLDGVTDHPYTYSMPPETIPYNRGLKKRDGIVVSENGSFEELIKSYVSLFKKTGKMRSLWMTEFGFTTFWFNGKNERGLYAGFTEQAQAVYIVRRFIEGLTLPIAASFQYDFIDDFGSSKFSAEANFGLLRSDYSRKPAFYATQRMNSLFNGYKYAANIPVIIEQAPLHRSCKRDNLIKSWDKVAIKASNGVKAFAFMNPELKKERMLAVWSMLPYSREFNNRVCSIRIKNIKEFTAKPVAIDLITGKSYDIDLELHEKDIILKNLVLKGNPIVIKFFKSQ